MSNNYNLLLFFMLSLVISTNSHVPLPALFIFGDSIFDPGNNNFLNVSISFKADFLPYGETFFNFPTGRHTDGRLIPDFIAMYADLPLWKPYLLPGWQNLTNGTNFASAGAGVLEGAQARTVVASQLRQELGDEEAEKILSNAVYFSSTAGMDYAFYVVDNPNAEESEVQQFINMVVGNLTNVIKDLYKIGGRKFAFQNVGPLGCLPNDREAFMLGDKLCYERLVAAAVYHNELLVNVTEELAEELPGFNYLIFDFFTSVLDRIKNPEKYGFKEAAVACCGAGVSVEMTVGELNITSYAAIQVSICSSMGSIQLNMDTSN